MFEWSNILLTYWVETKNTKNLTVEKKKTEVERQEMKRGQNTVKEKENNIKEGDTRRKNRGVRKGKRKRKGDEIWMAKWKVKWDGSIDRKKEGWKSEKLIWFLLSAIAASERWGNSKQQ